MEQDIKTKLVFVTGMPGAGKSSMARAMEMQLLHYDIRSIIIQTGEIARFLSGVFKSSAIYKGELFPLEDLIRNVMVDIIVQAKNNDTKFIIVDGAPRFLDQLKFLLQRFKDDFDVSFVFITADTDVMIKRMQTRNLSIDKTDVMMKRINDHSQYVIDMYKHLVDIDHERYAISTTNCSADEAASKVLEKMRLTC